MRALAQALKGQAIDEEVNETPSKPAEKSCVSQKGTVGETLLSEPVASSHKGAAIDPIAILATRRIESMRIAIRL